MNMGKILRSASHNIYKSLDAANRHYNHQFAHIGSELELKVFALQTLNDDIDTLWTEVVGSVGQMY
jgi:hypothetical protein